MTKLTDINQMEEGFKELQEYSDSQFHLITRLQENVARLEAENKSLKIMLEQNLPTIGSKPLDLSLGISNEQLICEVQLTMLKDLAVVRELTLEETKKFQTFTDVLTKVKAGKKPGEEFGVARMSDEELLKAAAINV